MIFFSQCGVSCWGFLRSYEFRCPWQLHWQFTFSDSSNWHLHFLPLLCPNPLTYALLFRFPFCKWVDFCFRRFEIHIPSELIDSFRYCLNAPPPLVSSDSLFQVLLQCSPSVSVIWIDSLFQVLLQCSPSVSDICSLFQILLQCSPSISDIFTLSGIASMLPLH